MKKIQLWKNSKELSDQFTEVDPDIFEILKNQKLYLNENNKNYIIFSNKNITGQNGAYYLHRYVARLNGFDIEKSEIDHIDRNKLNNQISNLREATHSENAGNQNSKSGKRNCKYKNVHLLNKKGKERWQVQIHKGEESCTWFSSNSILECIIFANIMRKKIWGEFAFIEDLNEFSEVEIYEATERVNRSIEIKRLKEMNKSK